MLRLCAALPCGLPRGEAITLTFGPLHAATFLDITIDAASENIVMVSGVRMEEQVSTAASTAGSLKE